MEKPPELKNVGQSEKKEGLLYAEKGYAAYLGEFQKAVDSSLAELRENKIVQRIWDHDHTVWKTDPKEITNRLDWLHSPEEMSEAVAEIQNFVKAVRADGFTHALLLGMGGSSLAPEVFRLTFGVKESYLDLAVLDSTDPGTVLEKRALADPRKTLFIVSTKSGGTVETVSFMKYFYNETLEAVGRSEAGDHFIAITDPGSGLESIAKELKFRKIFLNNPNIGGRYSALSFFGLVPAALIGVDISVVLERAAAMADNARSSNCPVDGDNTSAWLGSTIGELAKAGRDKVTLIVSPELQYFGAWVEQLVAESTGKEEKGLLPVTDEAVLSSGAYGRDRLFVYLRLAADSTWDKDVQAFKEADQPVIQLNLRDLYDLGGEFFRWEMATVIAGQRMGINPFDQPNVESAKLRAKEMVAVYSKEGKLPEENPTFASEEVQIFSDFKVKSHREALEKFLAAVEPGEEESRGRSYIAIQAYVHPTPEADRSLQDLRTKIQKYCRTAVTVGYGPR
ncbi:transaldolase, partial [Thermodesulfobacteriota bacterium]